MKRYIVFLVVFSFLSLGVAYAGAQSGATISATVPVSFNRNLSVGTQGEDVANLQTILINKGLLPVAKPTGYYGPLTAQAVTTLQVQNNLEGVGAVGPKTRALLVSELQAPSLPIQTTMTKPYPLPMPTTTKPNLTGCTDTTRYSPLTGMPCTSIFTETTPATPIATPYVPIRKGVDPKVMFWWGKVNQHTDPQTGEWMTDPNGLEPYAGASVDYLTYCKMFYPNTVSIEKYKLETIDSWHDRGNVSNYTSTNMSYRCVQPSVITNPTPTEPPIATTDCDSSTAPYIKVLSPNGGETYNAGQKITVKWTSCNAGNNVIIGMQGDGSYSMTAAFPYITNLPVANTGSSSYILPSSSLFFSPNGLVSGVPVYKIVVYVPQGIQDLSDNWFTINGPSVTTPFTIIYPNGGESFTQGQTINVAWSGGPVPSGVNLALVSASPFQVFSSLASALPNSPNSFSWTIPANVPNGTYYMNGGNNADGIWDYSDNVFTISSNSSSTCTLSSPQSVKVISPNGGESFTAGQQVTTTWETCNLPYNPYTLVAVMDDRIPNWQTLSLFGSVPALNYATLVSSTSIENVYQYTFTIPSSFDGTLPPQYQGIYGGNHYKILVTIGLGPTYQDSSNANFAINSQAPCVPGSSAGAISPTIDPNNPGSMNVAPGSNNVEIFRFDLRNTSTQNVCLNGIQLGSSSNLNNYINNVKIVDMSGMQIGSIVPSFSYNGSYYYQWVYPNPKVQLAPTSMKVFKVVANITSVAGAGSFNAGLWGLNFDTPGATAFGMPLNGNTMTVQ